MAGDNERDQQRGFREKGTASEIGRKRDVTVKSRGETETSGGAEVLVTPRPLCRHHNKAGKTA